MASPSSECHIQTNTKWRSGNQGEVKALLCPRFATESLQSVDSSSDGLYSLPEYFISQTLTT